MPDITRADLVNFWILTQNNRPLQNGFADYLKNFSNKPRAEELKKNLLAHLNKLENTSNLIIQDLKEDSSKLETFLEDLELPSMIKETQDEARLLVMPKQVIPVMQPDNRYKPQPDLVVQRHEKEEYEVNTADLFTLLKNSLTSINDSTTDLLLINQNLNVVPNIDALLRNLGISIICALKTNKLDLNTFNAAFTSTLDQFLILRALNASAMDHIQGQINDPEKTIKNLITYLSIVNKLNNTHFPKEYLINFLENLQSEFGAIGLFIKDNFENKALAIYFKVLEGMVDSETSAARIEKLLDYKDGEGNCIDAYLLAARNQEASMELAQLREKIKEILPTNQSEIELFTAGEDFAGKDASNLSDVDLSQLAAFSSFLSRKNPQSGRSAPSSAQSHQASKKNSGQATPFENAEELTNIKKPKN